jgi:hypothetical protein
MKPDIPATKNEEPIQTQNSKLKTKSLKPAVKNPAKINARVPENPA